MKKDKKKKLTDLQRRACELILSGWTMTKTANYLEVSRLSIYNWKRLPEWNEYANEIKNEIFDSRINQIRTIASLSLEIIENALKDDSFSTMKRADLAIKWLSLFKDNIKLNQQEEIAKPTTIDPQVLKQIREQIYGIYDVTPTVIYDEPDE